MATISSPGLGSGLDVGSIVAQLVAAEGQPATLRLDQREANYQAKISALGTFKSAVSEVQSSLVSLKTFSGLQGRTASSSDTDLLKVTSDTTAFPSSYTVSVEKLAQSHKLASAAFSDTTSSVTSGNGGTFTFRFGTYDGSTFTVNPEKATQTVSLDAADSSLEGIRNTINNADIGVTANIVNDGTGSRLVFVSNSSGKANSLEITITDDEMEAWISFDSDVSVPFDQLLGELAEAGVVSGIDWFFLQDLAEAHLPGQPYCIAQGIPPEEGLFLFREALDNT